MNFATMASKARNGAFVVFRIQTAVTPLRENAALSSRRRKILRKAITRSSLENKYKGLTKKPTPPSKLESTKKAVDATSELVNRAKKMDQDSRKAAKKERMDLSKKTDKELRDQINRELLERQYNDLFAKESVSKGRRYLSDVLDNAGTVLAVGSSALSIALAIQQLQKKAG